MKKKTHDAIIKHYNDLYKIHGQRPGALGWLKGRQNIRFRVVSEIGKMQNSKILDVGCGFGDLSSFLKSQYQIKYLGVDINPKFIEIAKQRNPKTRFEVRDIEKKKIKEKFDWVFAVGTTNKAGSYEYIENLLIQMLKVAKKGVAMDFMSSYVDFKASGSFHTSPEKIFKIAKNLSKRVVLRHDYLPFEFCVYIYKNNKFTKNQTFTDF